MTALLGSRRRAEDFSARVDELLSQHVGRPVSAGVRGGAARVQDDRLLGLVAALCEQADGAASPDPTYSRRLREQLLAEAAASPARRPGPPEQVAAVAAPAWERRGRRLATAAAASVAVMVTGTAGMAVGAQDALPGQALYPVKRGIEGLDETMSRNATAKGHAVLEAAETRLVEVRGLAESDDPGSVLQIPSTLAEFTRQAHQGASLLMTGYQQTGDPATIADLRTFAAKDAAVLTGLSVGTPSGAVQPLRDAAVALKVIDADATEACDDCTDLDPLEVPQVLTPPAGAGSSTIDDVQAVPGSGAGSGAATGAPAETAAGEGTGPATGQPGDQSGPSGDQSGASGDQSGASGDQSTDSGTDASGAADPDAPSGAASDSPDAPEDGGGVEAAPPGDTPADPTATQQPAPETTPTPGPTGAPTTASSPAGDGEPQDAPVGQSTASTATPASGDTPAADPPASSPVTDLPAGAAGVV